MKAKIIIASIGVLGYLAYLKLSKYLKENKVETANYIPNENGKTFFLNVDISENPLLKIPLLKWSIDKIQLKVNGETVAKSLKVNENTNNFTQEFEPVITANNESLKAGVNEKESIVEVTYKTIAGLKITHDYKINYFPANINTESNNNTESSKQGKTCNCQSI